MPLLELPGKMDSVPSVPRAMEKAVTPVGVDVKTRLETVREPSRVVAKVAPVTSEELKFSVSVDDGRAVAGVTPARSSDQLARLAHEAPVAPLK